MKKLALALVLAVPALAYADTADDLLKKGLALYKDGKYAEAVDVLTKAYAANPKPELLFPLAQAERNAGDCKAASIHYKKILEEIADLNTAKLVRQNLALCEPAEPDKPPTEKCETKPVEPPPPPKTIVREVDRGGHTDQVAVASAGAGALALGIATGFYFASSSTRDAADQAGSLSAHNTLADRADSERTAMIVSAGIGAAALGFAAFRWLTHDPAPRTDVALVPTSGGGAVWFSSRW
jgi:tetratricopeptide (TPR) repeat protein